ncbi:hypothetical protein GOP47_0015071 [Adiantum capillus-veneris]|uniref:Uncharacterized protein n=1 Tax=Adiantum capillus-veneris TaxID=13818 RepID=A0A9D4UNX0_ADICA|nr:hypothetical protein GOP47_0015071 [Adiantum capillus-veneris]
MIGVIRGCKTDSLRGSPIARVVPARRGEVESTRREQAKRSLAIQKESGIRVQKAVLSPGNKTTCWVYKKGRHSKGWYYIMKGRSVAGGLWSIFAGEPFVKRRGSGPSFPALGLWQRKGMVRGLAG